jgi:DivIVA domain-containing protein
VTFPLTDAKTLGYDPEAVDSFLERAREAFQGSDQSLTSTDLRAAAFPLKKGGYATTDVDTAVERLEDSFAERERDARIAEVGQDTWNAEARESAQDIVNRTGRPRGRRFRRGSLFSYGYNTTDVDEFTDRILSYFTAGEPLSRADVRNVTFRPQLRGYAESQVDAVLDELVRVMLAVR